MWKSQYADGRRQNFIFLHRAMKLEEKDKDKIGNQALISIKLAS